MKCDVCEREYMHYDGGCAACGADPPSPRFAPDPESGFVLDRETGEWLTTAEEVFDALSPLLPNVEAVGSAR